jgi:hypothetical protein
VLSSREAILDTGVPTTDRSARGEDRPPRDRANPVGSTGEWRSGSASARHAEGRRFESGLAYAIRGALVYPMPGTVRIRIRALPLTTMSSRRSSRRRARYGQRGILAMEVRKAGVLIGLENRDDPGRGRGSSILSASARTGSPALGQRP